MISSTCLWCNESFESSHLGRPAKFCKQSCKQRAYESRKWGIGAIWQHFQETYSDCYLCGDALDWGIPQALCMDHVIATVHGGRTDVENLRPVHLLCNAKKGASLYVTEEARDAMSSVQGLGHFSHDSDEKVVTGSGD